MADRRKLQGEIERCLKKVTEGVETFEDIWQKVHNATNTNQKEKYEADLKKEIKKLQRLRDQIKTWVASNEIKDKRVLLENRKLIETQMERFKVVERETKTKAYSKEGLGAAAKMDPHEKEKEEITSWSSQCIDDLNIQVDSFESEIEGLVARKKKLDRDKQDRVDQLRTYLERHRYHISKLETIMRMVDNDAIDIDQIKKIKEDVEYYVESNQEPDFEENEFIYDDLDLDEFSATTSANMATSPTDGDEFESMNSINSTSPSPSPSTVVVNHSKGTSSSSSSTTSSASSVTKGSQKGNSSGSSHSNNSVPVTPSKQNHPNGASGSTPLEGNGPTPTPTPPPSGQAYATAAGAHHNSTSGPTPPQQPIILQRPPQSNQQHNIGQPIVRTVTPNTLWNDEGLMNAFGEKPILNSVDHSGASNSSAHVNSSLAAANSVSTVTSESNQTIPPAPSPVTSVQPPVPSLPSGNLVNSNQKVIPGSEPPKVLMNGPSSAGAPSLLKQASSDDSPSISMTSLKSIAQQAVDSAGLASSSDSSQPPSSQSSVVPPASMFDGTSTSQVPQSIQSHVGQQSTAQVTSQTLSSLGVGAPPQTATIQLDPLLGVAPLGPQPLSKEHCYQLAMLDAAYHHLPHPSDSERLRTYLPHNPCPTPAYYPQVPPPHSDTVEFFQRLGTETLFFIFYYMEGTKAQYLAAKALKQKSWRFHTKYMMWFQRHEEPKTITEDYEQGTYIYFDYEKWGQRKKEGFTFEYRYLEDRDLN